MNREQSRRECSALVAYLDLPEPFDFEEFSARLSRDIGRNLVLMPHPMAIGGLCGIWLRTAKADYVFYEENTSLLHQQHIVFHEIGHILRAHRPCGDLSKDLARAIAAGMTVSDIYRVLGHSYDEDNEFEAELIATLILRRIGRQPLRELPQATDPNADDLVARITTSLSRGDR